MQDLASFVLACFVLSVGCDERSESDAGLRESGMGDSGGTDARADAGGPCAPGALPDLAVEEIVPDTLWDRPLFVVQPAGVDALFVVEQPGRILRVDGREVTEFLDVRSRIQFGGERGLLGLAFHPEYAENGRFFIYYTPNSAHQNVVAEYARSAEDPDIADDTELSRLVVIDDPEDNHNGGMLAFGPDGFLYVGTGDGGGGGDRHGPTGNGLNLDVLMGKILRLDVENVAGGYVAEGNPFVGEEGADPIWAYGLRNPWRFSFDRATGDLFIADVGQNRWEEINVQPATSAGGENYGWRAYEGWEVFDQDNLERAGNHTAPVHVIQHGVDEVMPGACSVTGGYVYRGDAIPELRGWYVFGDYCSSERAALRVCGDGVEYRRLPGLSGGLITNLSSFGEDQSGELYMTGSDRVVRIIAAP